MAPELPRPRLLALTTEGPGRARGTLLVYKCFI